MPPTSARARGAFVSLDSLRPPKLCCCVLLQKSAGRPLIVVVQDNRTAEDFVPVLQAFHELIGGNEPDSMVSLPAAMFCRFRIFLRILKFRKNAPSRYGKSRPARLRLWFRQSRRRLCGLRSAEYYADLARMVRRGETLDIEPLLRHLNTVGYTSTDVVEMPGEYALRGGILDVYSPEADRPLRIEFFGDEVESIRKFDPATQRSSTPVDEALLLPLTETPVSEDLLGAIHARLSGKRITGAEEIVEQAVRAGGVTRFSRLGVLCAGGGRGPHSLRSCCRNAAVLADEPESLQARI